MGHADTQHAIERTTVDLDLDALSAALVILGTETVSDTVNAALREVRRRAQLTLAAELILRGGREVLEPDELRTLRHSGLAS